MAQQKQGITLQTRSPSLLLSTSEFPPPPCCTAKSFQVSILQSCERGDILFTCTVAALMVTKYLASWEMAMAQTPSSEWLSKMVCTGTLRSRDPMSAPGSTGGSRQSPGKVWHNPPTLLCVEEGTEGGKLQTRCCHKLVFSVLSIPSS